MLLSHHVIQGAGPHPDRQRAARRGGARGAPCFGGPAVAAVAAVGIVGIRPRAK
jgi:hypothetical protein